ncbi:hypothetical protein BDZ91DRAFT_708883 [Kalaharituber pfeilii]|nr:hypothetical protein BDZ91DRAFT_708883 [Kalaharituber pfeilii]
MSTRSRMLPITLKEAALDSPTFRERFAEGSKEYWGHVMGVAKKLEQTVIEPLSQLQRGELKNFKEVRRQLESSQAKYDTLQSRYAAQSKTKDPSALREDAFQLYEARKIYFKACFDFNVSVAILRSSLDRTVTIVLSEQWREQNILRNRGHITMDKFNSEMARVRAWSDSMELCERALKKELIMQRRAIEEQVKKDTHPARDLDEYTVSTVPYLNSKDMSGAISSTMTSERQGWLFMRSFTAKPTRAIWVKRWFFLRNGIFGYLMQGYRGGAVEESEKIGVLLCNVKPAFQEERRFCFEVKTKDTTILLQAETQADLTAWIATFEQAKRTAVNSSPSIAVQASSIIPPSAPPPDLSVKEHLQHDDISVSFDRALTLPLSGSPIEKSGGGVLGSRTGDGTKSKDRSDRIPAPIITPTPTSAIGALMTATYGSFSADLKHSGVPATPLPPGNTGDSNALQVHPQIVPLSPKISLAPNTLATSHAPSSLMKAAVVTASSSTLECSKPSTEAAKQSVKTKHKKSASLDSSLNVMQGRQKSYGAHWLPAIPAISEDEIYPPNYPQQLKTQDAHFRVLFPGEPVTDPVLFVFLSAWVLKDRQEISGRCYVTRKSLYFYSHFLGLVYKRVLPLDTIEEVRASPGKDADHIFFHLRPKDPDDSDYEDGDDNSLKIVLKTFLDPVKLLHRRLGLLIKNEVEEHTLKNTAEILDKLVALEHEPEASLAPDSESWEEISDVNPDGHEDSGTFRRELNTPSERPTPRKAVMLKVAPPARFKFPENPVTYTPERMKKKSLEREFDVPAKALFHVMFGCKAVVFQRLYQGRRAQDIYQGPWFRLGGGRLKRDLTYEIENKDFFRRARRTTVVDYQTIETIDDHLCYVITDRKTPWHLPLQDQFMLITKLVITYVSKSRCKLTIWTAVEWSNSGRQTFSKGIIQRQALDDLDIDATDLADIVEVEVRKLGTENRVRNAMSMFGVVDETAEGDITCKPDSDPSGHPNRQRVTQRSLVHMISENIVSLGKSTLSTIVLWIIAGITTAIGIISAQRIILGLLVLSAGSNIMLSSRSTMAYWSEWRATKFLNEIGVSPNRMMSKAIYLADMEELVKNGTELALMPDNQCYSKFRELVSQIDLDASVDHVVDGIGYKSASTRTMARNLMRTRQNLGTYRHDLLVALRLVNRMERDIIQSEWENWLIDEDMKCRKASIMLRRKRDVVAGIESGEEDGPEEIVEDVARWMMEYCGSCENERRELWKMGKRLDFV